jgi:superfamily II DNA or RNA helicase
MAANPGDWLWSEEHREICRVVETQRLWGDTSCRVWLPTRDAIVRVAAEKLRSAAHAGIAGPAGLTYIAAAARVADALTQDVLLAPMAASVIPLPHQLRALARAIEGDRVRYLLADEVGLGKTIEAGLILRELKLRGRVRRCLVVAPKGLVTQWVAEMRVHFGEEFRLLIPGEFSAYRSIAGEENLWRACDQVVCPMDAVKPLDGRRGWSREQVAAYNRERFEDLIAAGWDLVIVDEAHRLGGSTEQVARFKLGQGLAEAAPYLLLLSATPHQGKTEAFHRLVSLLDERAFPDAASVTRERVQPYVIRTEKRRAIDAQGQPLFQPRQTRLIPIAWEEQHREQRLLYEAITEYVREGYNQALVEKRSYIGFLMLLMQRLVTSSTRAIRTTLERRLEVLKEPEEQLSLFPELTEEWLDLDAQEQLDTLLRARLKATRNEQVEVQLLLRAARACEARGPDAKAEALLDWVYGLQQEETDPALKLLVFTEFVPTQEMLRDFLTERGFSVVCLNGSMGMEERQRVQEAFAREARVLISTDAGGEGLNLQFCHVVVNYDIPWNPMRLEQRIGRVDRIGQRHAVRALNLVLKGTVEHRVREVLEQKLAVILQEFGVDKAGDVLDSAESGALFDDLYVAAVLAPERIDAEVEAVVERVREQAQVTRDGASMLAEDAPIDAAIARRVADHPLPHWVERMTTAYLQSRGGQVARNGAAYRLIWPDGVEMADVVFARHEDDPSSARVLTLDDPRVRGLATRLPRFAPGQPLAVLRLRDLPAEIQGWWSLWRIALHTAEWNRQRIMPLFRHDDGRVLGPTARRLWDRLLDDPGVVAGQIEGQAAWDAFAAVERAAEAQGRSIYEELVREHRQRVAQEREKGLFAFGSRRRAIERIGLPAVRGHRLAQLADEERNWREQIEQQAEAGPELAPLLLVRVEACGPDG